MSDIQNEATENLIRALVQNIDGPQVDWDNWASMTIVVDSFEGQFNSASGYLYSPDGTISAVSADPWKVLPFVEAYVSGYYQSGDALPVKFLVQYDRTSGKYAITFEDTDESRWKITPKNFKELREELRPKLNGADETPTESE